MMDTEKFKLDSISIRNFDLRVAWSSIVPASVALFLCIGFIPLPSPISKALGFLKSPFRSFITLSEAETYTNEVKPEDEHSELKKCDAPAWFTITLSFLAVLETMFWTGLACYLASANHDKDNSKTAVWAAFKAFSWTYAALKPILQPTATAAYDLFALYIAQLVAKLVVLGAIIFDHTVSDAPLPGLSVLIAHITDFAVIISSLVLVLTRPLGIPSNSIARNEIGKTVSPEEYTTLWEWLSCTWVHPLIKRGTHNTLNEIDVWELSPTNQAQTCFEKFRHVKKKSLLRRILAANSRDLILDFLITYISVVLNYSGPFFLKRILDCLSLYPFSKEKHMEAYMFAGLAFVFHILKAQANSQHTYFADRAATRIRSELMASIYDKALKRKEFSVIADNKDDNASDDDNLKDKNVADEVGGSEAGAGIGKIVNLMSSDASKISSTVTVIHTVYAAPFEIVIACVFLYQLLGWPAFAGFSFLILGWPINSYLAGRSVQMKKGYLSAKDKRMGVLNELIGSIKFIKFFAWEGKWIERVMDTRNAELNWIIKSRINDVFFWILWSSVPTVVSIISFFTFVSLGNELTVGIAFTSISIFDMLRRPLQVAPTWIVEIIQSKVALDRIDAFLKEDEVTDQVSSLKSETGTIGNNGSGRYNSFGVKNASFRWNSGGMKFTSGKNDFPSSRNSTLESDQQPDDDHRFELHDISLILPEGELSVVTGPTASGKSALLLALLGEMTLLPGGEIIMTKDTSRIDEHGLTHSISYAAQSPWLQHETIKKNILFGSLYEGDRYNEVVKCCALKPDLEILEDGDATEIGARGISLSGGQKARVALARAVYNRSKYVLLDDPLSAVDSHTARFLYERLFLGPLMKNRTVVLVTHHVELVLSGAYYLVQMLDGKIDIQGPVSELKERGLINELIGNAYEEKQEILEEAVLETKKGVAAAKGTPEYASKQTKKLVEEEKRESGGVGWLTYKTYLRNPSYWIWFTVLMLLILLELVMIANKYWINIWGEAYESNATYLPENIFVITGKSWQSRNFLQNAYQRTTSVLLWDIRDNLPSAKLHPIFYVGVFAAIAAVHNLLAIVCISLAYVAGVRASRVLFRTLLHTVTNATMRWHDVTPTGRMLNRFGKDIETIDTTLYNSLLAANSFLIAFLTSIAVVTVIFPVFIIPAIILGYFYYIIAVGYLNTGRDLKRIESTTRSPIFSGFSEMLEGIVTVRAFSAERRFMKSLYKKVDVSATMWYNFWMINRWLLLHFDVLGATAVLIATLLALHGVVGGGIAGFVITSAMTFTETVYWACRIWTELELDMNSVERVVQYLTLPQEPPAIIKSNRPPAHWPTAQKNEPLLSVEELEVKYAPDLPSVLHGVTFSLKAGERVGLIGRTGSGKSTLAMSILRFTDPTSGRINIGGIDITTIGVHDLRERITFIPQDAVLFSGTLRDNINPFGEYTDAECLDVLQRVQIITKSESRPPSFLPSVVETSRPVPATQGEETNEMCISRTSGITDTGVKLQITLDTQVSAGGTNFSQGQRQLISMARALLRQTSILILDEATSSIDFDTDAKMQSTIREEFKNSLLLTVAHRLRTIIDYDRLIVLEKGKIAEIDTPNNLIQKKGGIFREMCLKSGTFTELEMSAI